MIAENWSYMVPGTGPPVSTPLSVNQSCQARGRVSMCNSGIESSARGSPLACPERSEGAQTGNTCSCFSSSRWVPGQSPVPKWIAASKGSPVKLNGCSRVAMLMVTSGCSRANSGSRGISQRMPKAGRMARLSAPPACGTCSRIEAWAIWRRAGRISAT